MDADETIFCRREGRSFPATEFYEDEIWGKVHRKRPPHTTGGTDVPTGRRSAGGGGGGGGTHSRPVPLDRFDAP